MAEEARDPTTGSVAITAAMPSGTGLDKFAAKFPDRTFDVGIAEQHAVTFAAGMAAQGMRPFAAIYSTFLQRAYDQVVHDVAIQNLPVRFAIDRAGLVGADGATHAGSFDVTYLATLPNMVVMLGGRRASWMVERVPIRHRPAGLEPRSIRLAPAARPARATEKKHMESRFEAQVLIVGAGPVGLTLAMDLGSRGISVIVAEQRPRGARPEPKCNHVAARSMEIFRRLGVVEQVRNAGLPPDYPNDVAYRTTFVGEELSRIPIPARQDRYTATGGPDTWWPTPEPPHRINQIYLEPILFDHAERNDHVRILTGVRVEAIVQSEGDVQAEGIDLATGARISMHAAYAVGCDGGRSNVRKAIGASFHGTEVVGRVQSTFFRAPDLLRRAAQRPAWATFSLNPRRSGNVYAIDGRETFLLHNYLRQGETDFESVDRDWAIRTILGVGPDFQYEILSKEDWVGRRLVANRLRDRRVFICGDAAHLWIPMAGYGMNAGIADATNLAFHLAGRLAGWATDAALDAYEGRAPSHHRTSLALRDGPRAGIAEGTRRRAGRHRGPHARGRPAPASDRQDPP